MEACLPENFVPVVVKVDKIILKAVNPRGSVKVFYPRITLKGLLDTYISTDVTVYLPGSSVKKIESSGGRPESKRGKSRILWGFRMDERVPISADVRQTVWDHGNGSGHIRVTSLSGPLMGYIDVDLKEKYDSNGLPGVYASWNLINISVKVCNTMHEITNVLAKTMAKIPFLRLFKQVPTAILDIMGQLPLIVIASTIVHYAVKIPPVLLELEYKKRAAPRA